MACLVLADAVCAVDALVVGAGVPGGVQDDNSGGGGEGEAEAPHLGRKQAHCDAGVPLELVNSLLPLPGPSKAAVDAKPPRALRSQTGLHSQHSSRTIMTHSQH